MKWTALYFKRGDTEALNSQIKQPFIKAQRNERFIYNLSASLSFFWHTFLGLIAKEQRNSMMQSYQALLEQMSGQKRQTIDRLLKRSSNSTSSPGCIQLRCMGSGHQGKRKLTATMLRYDVRFKQSWCHWHRKGNSKKKRKCLSLVKPYSEPGFSLPRSKSTCAFYLHLSIIESDFHVWCWEHWRFVTSTEQKPSISFQKQKHITPSVVFIWTGASILYWKQFRERSGN